MSNELLNPAKILAQCQEFLRSPELSQGSVLSPDEEALLFAHKPISCPYGENRFLACPIFLEDKKENCYSPLFVLSGFLVKDSSLFIWNEEEPLFNPYVRDLLVNALLEVPSLENGDLALFLKALRQELQAKGKERFELCSYLKFYDADILFSFSSYDVVSRYQNEGKTEEKYQGFFFSLKEEGKEKEISRFVQSGLFSPYRRAWTSLDYYPAIQASYPDESVAFDFLCETLSMEIQVGKKITVLCLDDKERDYLTKIFNDHCPMDSSLEDSRLEEETRRLEEARRNYLVLLKKKKDLFLYPNLKEDLANVLFETILQPDIPYEEYDLAGYSDSCFEKDQEFLEELLNFSDYRNQPIDQHPFFGLSCQNLNANYDHLILLLIDCKKKLRDFLEQLKKEEFTMLDGKEIRTFFDFEETGKDLDVLHDYNGFPRRLFRIPNPEDSSYRIQDLKQCYQSLSSTRLLLSSFCKEEILSLDLVSLVENYRNGSFFVRRKAKKTILSYLLVDKNSVDTVVRVLESYLKAKKELDRILPSYIEIYGESVSTMNGASEIEANIHYLKKFRMRSNYHPLFQLDNPIVKKSLRDARYRNDLYASYQRLLSLYQSLKQSFNSYLGFFLDGPKDDFHTDFSDLLGRIDRQLFSSRNDFLSYARIKSYYQDTSYLLKTKMEEATKNGDRFSDFPKKFLYCLYHTIYSQAESQSTELDLTLNEARRNYEQLLHDADRVFALSLRKKIEEKGKDRLSLVTIKEPIEKDSDLVILFESGRYSDAQLLYALGLGKNVLLLESKEDLDKRLFGYPTISLDYADLYGFAFDFHRLPLTLYRGIISVSDKLGYEIVRTDPRFPLSLRKKGEEELSYIVVPDVMMNPEYFAETETMLREFFFSLYHLKMISFISFEGGFEKENILKREFSLT